jgi:hypothetical protein
MLRQAPLHPSSPEGPPLTGRESVRRFLLESERRVMLHCQKMLAANKLTEEQHRRLIRLLDEASDQLRRLAI